MLTAGATVDVGAGALGTVDVVAAVVAVVAATDVGATVVGATVVGGTDVDVGGTVVGRTVVDVDVDATVVDDTAVGATVVGRTVVGGTVVGRTVVDVDVGATVVVGAEDVEPLDAAVAPPSVDSATEASVISASSVVSAGEVDAGGWLVSLGSLVSAGTDDSTAAVVGAELGELDVSTVELATSSGSVVSTAGLSAVSIEGAASGDPIDELTTVDDVVTTTRGSALAPESAGPTKNHPKALQHTIITDATASVRPRLRPG